MLQGTHNPDDLECDDEYQEDYDTLFTQYKSSTSRSQAKNRPYHPNYPRYTHQSNTRPSNLPWRAPKPATTRPPGRGRNPPNRSGLPTRCMICQSINHWAQNCPDKEPYEHSTYVVNNEVVLHQTDYDQPNELKSLISETWSSALLDCGASKTVCGKELFTQYINNLQDVDQKEIQISNSNHTYRFGDGHKIKAIHSAIIPAIIGSRKVKIDTDVIEGDIPLLLSKSSMKKVNMKLNFQDDTVNVFNENIPLITTISGHYAIPLTTAKQLINNIDRGLTTSITLSVTSNKSNHEIALKLHRQFAHPSQDKLLQLVSNAGHPWCNNQELKEEIKSVSENCSTCKIYKKPPSRPIVGLPMASQFQETVAMDLKFYHGRIILHLIDHCTRLSASSVIPNKNPDTIIKYIFKIWISVYGVAEKFLTDNGGEFANNKFMEMCESLGIKIKTTAAEAPWSNGLVERHNLILSEMLDKVLEETKCEFDLALAWRINAKNSLANIHGFSPYQLVMGTNPRLPSVLNDKAPALTSNPSNNTILKNLEALHKAREAFIASENSEKIRRALSHNIRTSGDIKYITGDQIYYKRSNSRERHGPATVLGQDGQQVLIKMGSIYIRVHPCRLQLISNTSGQADLTSSGYYSPVNSQNRATSQTLQPEQVNSDTESCSSDDEIGESSGNNHFPLNPVQPLKNQSVTMNQHEDDNNKNNKETNNSQPNPGKIKPNDYINYRCNNNSKWETVKVLSRAGKATGKYSNCWNTENENGHQKYVDFSKVQWKQVNPPNTLSTPDEDLTEQLANVALDPTMNQNDITTQSVSSKDVDEVVLHDTLLVKNETDILEAKTKELQQWKKENVFIEEEDQGQACISLRWVLREKIINDKKSIKARLCARGFEEEQNFRTDSPTCSREGLRLACCLITTYHWVLNSLDVKTAFLQGKILERTVYVRPPKEANTNKIWRLRKCVYGLADASRYWYLTLREELIKLGATPSQLDQGIFTSYHQEKPQGLLVCFVDDVLWGGTTEFKTTIEKLKNKFQIGCEHKEVFDYIGIRLEQNPENFSVKIHQKEYIASLNTIPLTKEQQQNPNCSLTQDETKMLRAALGKLNWVANMTRPEISFYVCDVSTRIKIATISDILAVNKVIKFIQNTDSFITIPSFDINSLGVILYSDASFNNLPNGGSQGGYLVFVQDKYGNSMPIVWNSSRLKRVTCSTLAAETLALRDGCDAAFYTANLLADITHKNLSDTLNIQAFTDNQSL